MEPSDGFHLSTQDSAMALPGIANENEFYSAHYLDAILTERPEAGVEAVAGGGHPQRW